MEARAAVVTAPEQGILRRLVSLSWPLTVSEFLGILVPVIDMVWIGKLGAEAIAGAGMAASVAAVIMSSISGLNIGLRATVSRLVGAGDHDGAVHMLKQAFVIALVFTAVVAVAGGLLSRPLLSTFGLEAKAVDQGTPYLALMLAATPLFTCRLLAEAAMQASGDAVTPMKITVAHRILHAGLSPALVFGWLFFPELGVRGAAWAPIAAQSVALALGLWVLTTGRTRLRLKLLPLRVVRRDIWRLVKLSAPTSVAFMQNDLGQTVIGWIMVPFGTTAVAAHVVARRIEQVLFMPISGLGLASGILTGQYLGIKRPDIAAKNGWIAAGIAASFGLVSAAAVLLFAPSIVGVFNSEPGLVGMATSFARIGSWSYALIGVIVVFLTCLNGAGDTVPPMLIMAGCLWLIGIPLAFFLPRATGMSVYGLRWMLQSIAVLTAAGFVVYYQSGRWKTRKI